MSNLPPTVGIVGLGLLGSALAQRLRGGGVEVLGYDLDSRRCDEFAASGGRVAFSSESVAAESPVLLLSLPTSDIVATVLCQMESQLAGKAVIDTTTGDPEVMAGFGRRLESLGATYLDATLAGSSAQVRQGEAIVLLGGSKEKVTELLPLLRLFAREVFHLGPCGSGARMKLVVNLVLGLNRAALGEGLAFAERLRVDAQQALLVLSAGPAFSRVMETKGQKMLARDFQPEARLQQHLKDVGLILAAGEAAGAKLPLSQLHRSLLEEVVAAGGGELDNSAIIEAFRDVQPGGEKS